MLFYHIAIRAVKLYLLIFYRIKITGLENIPSNGPAILCSNHASILDPLVVGCFARRRVIYMAKEELFKNKIFSWVIQQLGSFPVKRDATDITAIKMAIQILKQGNAFGIFIEGKRSKTGELQKPKGGTVLIALKGNAPIVPIGISSNYKLFSKIHVLIGKPIFLDEYKGKKVSNEEMEDISENIMQEIKRLIL